jgi:GNAT superfamily N-acetyltransferase
MQVVRGEAFGEHIEELGQFRIAIFREYPYLYDGDMAYERAYLERYAAHPDSILLRVDDEKGMVGACTGLPLQCEPDTFQAAFPESDREKLFYIGELILRADARSHGLGTQLFSAMLDLIERERYPKICLCMVEREKTHPLRPENYISPEPLARKFGFAKCDLARAELSWRDIGEQHETAKPMQIWYKE